MSKPLVVFGATGQQGGSLIDTVLKDATLSKQYQLRAITRDSSKPAAQSLQARGVEVVQANSDDQASLQQTMRGAHTVFIVTMTNYSLGGKDAEIKHGKLIVDAAISAGAQYLIFSTSPSPNKIAGKPVDIFDAKAEIEDYIRSLKVKSAFYAPGCFMENFRTHTKPRPTEEPGVYQIANIPYNDTKIPLLDTAGDTGKFIAPILADPEKYVRKSICGATRMYSYDEVVQAISDATGKEVVYRSLQSDVFAGFMPPEFARNAVPMLEWFRDSGYYGPTTQEEVDWSVQQVSDSLTTFEDFLSKNPIDLQ